MTTNADILAKADAVAALISQKLYDELTAPVEIPQVQLPTGGAMVPPVVPVIQDLELMASIASSTAAAVRDEFVWFTEPDPAKVADMLGSLAHILGSFGNPLRDPAIGYISDVQSNVVDWYGSAAEAFRLTFLNPFFAIRENQIALVGELATILEAYQKILTESRAQIIEVGDLMITALNALPGGGVSLPVVISVFTAMVGVLAAAYSGGATLTIPLAVLGGVLGVATEVADSGLIQGSNVQGVIDSMNSTLALIRGEMTAAEQWLVSALNHDIGMLADAEAAAVLRQLNYFVPLRPNVIDVISGTDVDFEYSGNG
jgi:hypothetical protein